MKDKHLWKDAHIPASRKSSLTKILLFMQTYFTDALETLTLPRQQQNVAATQQTMSTPDKTVH
jgi:hypothetical protein